MFSALLLFFVLIGRSHKSELYHKVQVSAYLSKLPRIQIRTGKVQLSGTANALLHFRIGYILFLSRLKSAPPFGVGMFFAIRIPAGNHLARLYDIIHIVTITTQWQGVEKMTDKIRLTFELCNEKKEFREGEGEKPFSISRELTYSFGAKGNLRPFIDGMTGTKMIDGEWPDLEALLGELAC